jgi:4-amino-4-deoxy-L-arabinose transferase-like glycosyltransferase
MKARYIIIILLLVSLLIKLYPPLSNEFLVNFDSIYHARIGQEVARTGWVPFWDNVAGGRPHLYPPGYHLMLGYSSMLLGIQVFDLIQYILPIISVLLILPAYFLIKKHRDGKAALWGAAFMAFNPIITSQSYDSPQLFGLLLLPLIAHFMLKGDYLSTGLLFGISLFFNYFVSITILALLVCFALVKYIRGDRKAMLFTILAAAIGIGLVSPWLLISLSKAGECFDPSTAVSGINEAGEGYLLMIAPFLAFLGFGLLYWMREKHDDYSLFWMTGLFLGTVGFLASLAFPELHPYDQLLLFGFSLVFILPELKLKKQYKVQIVATMLIGSALAVFWVHPALSGDDLAAVDWIIENTGPSNNVLANTEVSGTINMRSRNIRTEFDLFLECIPDSDRWADMHQALLTSDSAEAGLILERYGTDYVIVGARDIWNYGFDIEKFEELGELVYVSGDSKIYKIR